MAIYGVGAYYDNEYDVSGDFIERGVACVGWNEREAPTLHNILRCIKIGDIMYIKAQPIGQGLIVKAVGIVTDNSPREVRSEDDYWGVGVGVNWLWVGNENLGVISDKYNVRSITLYEEFNAQIQTKLIQLLTHKIA